MKKSLAICLSMLLLLATSCLRSTDEGISSPYAILKSFSIGDLKSRYPAFTAAGVDTFETRVITGSSLPFSIDQAAGEVYNADSLPFATNVDKVVVNMDLSGYAQIMNDSTGLFETFLSTDSLDFTTPRKFRITSLDMQYYKDYRISVNVHQVEPELMAWNGYAPVDAEILPQRAIEYNGEMYLFGGKNGEPVLASSPLTGAPSWNVVPLEKLPATANLSTIQQFKGALYLVADDGIYTSNNAIEWSLCYACTDAVAIVGASDADGRMWVATVGELLVTTDGVEYESKGALPEGFPLYGVSIASYVMSHNKGITRYMLVGYTTEAMDGDAAVWSRLSTENCWTKYENENNPFPCPSLRGLTVLRYDDFLYAFGGAGVAHGEAAVAFSSFYISRDNGITWKVPEGFYQRMPAGLQGREVQFAATADSNNMIWVVCATGDAAEVKAAVWKGMINRLGFKDR